MNLLYLVVQRFTAWDLSPILLIFSHLTPELEVLEIFLTFHKKWQSESQSFPS